MYTAFNCISYLKDQGWLEYLITLGMENNNRFTKKI